MEKRLRAFDCGEPREPVWKRPKKSGVAKRRVSLCLVESNNPWSNILHHSRRFIFNQRFGG